MRVCANMHDINTNNYVIHTHIYGSCTSTYDNIRLITNMFKLMHQSIESLGGGGGRDLAGKHGASAKYCFK